MAKRHRTRPRQRRPVDSAHRTAAPRAEREEAPAARTTASAARTPAHRTVRGSRTGYSRAAGAASNTLDRAALLERNFISKDLRKLALVVGIALAILVIAGMLESTLLGR
jgi:hypothetical protein